MYLKPFCVNNFADIQEKYSLIDKDTYDILLLLATSCTHIISAPSVGRVQLHSMCGEHAMIWEAAFFLYLNIAYLVVEYKKIILACS